MIKISTLVIIFNKLRLNNNLKENIKATLEAKNKV